MNLLAHLHLGDQLSTTAAAGNLTADFCRESGSTEFQFGIRVHRVIDGFTDSHPTVLRARRIFSGPMLRFAPVLVDLVFDYCLSRSWETWSPRESRLNFIDGRLQALQDTADTLPPLAAETVDLIATECWLHGYNETSGIQSAIDRIVLRRPPFAAMSAAINVLEDRKDDVQRAFDEFYPQLIDKTAEAITMG